MNLENYARQPLKLQQNRVWRPFYGGLLLDRWQNRSQPQDGSKAEEWVASTLEARNPRPFPGEGLSRVDLPDGKTVTLRELLVAAPEAFLGTTHFHKYGLSLAILVKVLDSASRLMIQVHPDRRYAQEILQSPFGKTEAWVILGEREIAGKAPCVLLGFKPGITRQHWQNLFERQDIPGMLAALHRFPVQTGEVYLVEGGVPHAAGPGCFFMEIQEPTDFTMRVERCSPAGVSLADEQLHQGVGFERMLDCFHYEGLTAEDTLQRRRLQPQLIREEAGGRRIRMIGAQDTPFFAMERLEVRGELKLAAEPYFSVTVILQGSGWLRWDGGRMAVVQADEVFLPATVGSITLEAQPGTELSLIRCLPPG
jgi:mannose-6-phosphate isomerase